MSAPFVLLVLDGYGLGPDTEWNAVARAQTPVFDRLFRDAPWAPLGASGLAVGLPEGQMGNSEVGHLNIGAGRVVDQDLVRISKAVAAGGLDANPAFREAVVAVRPGGAFHVVGLLSDGGVHALQTHLHGAVAAAARLGAGHIYVHAILDGRDTPPRSAVAYLRALDAFLAGVPQARLASVAGRFYTMDRDQRWERVQRGYDLLTRGDGRSAPDAVAAVEASYAEGVSDEFVEPVLVDPAGIVRDGDCVFFANFRADRMRQIVTAFSDDDFMGFTRTAHPRVHVATMNRYHEGWSLPVLFPPQDVQNHLGAVLAAAGRTQLRLAETEKFAHVTYFFNGGSDEASPGEDRVLVPSPKVATYDLAPEMSVREVAAGAVADLAAGHHDVLILNIANPDMVGHTGDLAATVRAVEVTDAALGEILAAVERAGGMALITADHGNCERMFDPSTGQPHTAHTGSPVPCVLVGAGPRTLRQDGVLADVAPTVLALLGLPQPAEMTGRSLLV